MTLRVVLQKIVNKIETTNNNRAIHISFTTREQDLVIQELFDLKFFFENEKNILPRSNQLKKVRLMNNLI